MRISKKILRLASLAFAFILAAAVNVSGATYSDVPSWATSAVDKVTSLGYMSGDLSGKFNCSDYIDKFETSRILAKMLGYKSTGATAAEQTYYDSCYSKHANYIKLYSNKFAKWNKATDKEIAFLIEKGVYTEDDLNQFVLIVDGQERLKALAKEEAAMFLVKLMGKGSAALSSATGAAFADDSSISAAFKPYVYFMKNSGLVSGDENNRFNPKSAATKLIMAVMVNSVYNYMNPSTVTPPPATAPPTTGAPSAPTSVETITGTIAKLYSTLRALQVGSSDANYNNKIYIVSERASIFVNGASKTYADLAEGMTFVGVIAASELVSVNAATGLGTTAPPTIPSVPTTPPASSAIDYSNIEGTVTLTKTENGANQISIEVRMLNTRGDIYTETRAFTLAGDCSITRGGAAATFASIVKGDIVKAKIYNNYAYGLQLEQKNRSITGEITAKQFMTTTSLPLITVKDAAGNSYDLKVSSTSTLYRRGVGYVQWNELRVGDSVDVAAEYDVITTLNASGILTYKDAYIKDIYISNEFSRITATDEKNVDSEHYLISGVDPYALRVGSKVRLTLDSKEVQGVSLLENATTATVTGIVTYATSTRLTVKDAATNYTTTREIILTPDTIFYDVSLGKNVSYYNIYSDMKVYVVFTNNSNNTAKTVTILSR